MLKKTLKVIFDRSSYLLLNIREDIFIEVEHLKNFALLGFLYIGVSVVLLAVGLILDAAIVVHSEGLIVLAVLGLL